MLREILDTSDTFVEAFVVSPGFLGPSGSSILSTTLAFFGWLAFEKAPYGFGSKRKPLGTTGFGLILPFTNRVFGIPFFDP